jgi:RimJ/RimL family protein N-acetyltransferase
VAASHDPETRRWLDDDPLPAVADEAAREAAMTRVEEVWRSGRATPLVVADARTGEPVGLVNTQFRSDVSASIAYSVFPQHRGCGIARRTVQLVVPWALSLGTTELVLEIDEGNLASIRVAETCGFVPDGKDAEGKLVFRYAGPGASQQ